MKEKERLDNWFIANTNGDEKGNSDISEFIDFYHGGCDRKFTPLKGYYLFGNLLAKGEATGEKVVAAINAIAKYPAGHDGVYMLRITSNDGRAFVLDSRKMDVELRSELEKNSGSYNTVYPYS